MAMTQQGKWVGKREESVLLTVCFCEGPVAVKVNLCLMRKSQQRDKMKMCAGGQCIWADVAGR